MESKGEEEEEMQSVDTSADGEIETKVITSNEKDGSESDSADETVAYEKTSGDEKVASEITPGDEKDVAESISVDERVASEITPGDEKVVVESISVDEKVASEITPGDEKVEPESTSIDEKDVAESAPQEEEEEECGFCIFMKLGPCGNEFRLWQDCVEGAEKAQKDIVEQCAQTTSLLKACMEVNPQYYGPVLDAEKAMEADLASAEEARTDGAAAAPVTG